MQEGDFMLTFFGGVLASLLATALWYLFSVISAYRRFGHLLGYWVQVIPEFTGRTYSIGRFTYNKSSRSFQWDGTNYMIDGKPHCDWESIHLHLDMPAQKILYTYRGNRHSKAYSQFYGFGVMDLQEDNAGNFTPTTGHFQDAQEATIPQGFTMYRIENVVSRLNIMQGARTLKEFHSDIIRRYHDYNTSNSSDLISHENN